MQVVFQGDGEDCEVRCDLSEKALRGGGVPLRG
jgi:hypothetical protein